MESTQLIRIHNKHNHGLVKLKDVRANVFHMYDYVTTRVFFSYTKKSYEIMHKVTIQWDDGALTTITMINTKQFKIRYKKTFQKISNIPINSRSSFGENRKGKIIKKEYITGRPSYIFTDRGYLELNGILVKCKSKKILRHTRQSSRISRFLVKPNLCPFMKYCL